ncbi:Translation initiation factor 3 subunit b [Sorochytrium milnesiophthora]
MPVDIENIPLDIDETDDVVLDEYIDYADIEAEHALPDEVSFENMLVVDGLPEVDEAKKDKLLSVVIKKFAKEGINVNDDSIVMPMDDATGSSKGFAFIEFATAQEATAALKTLQGYKFDSRHTLHFNLFDDVEKYATVEEQWDEIAAVGEETEFKEKEFLRSWLLDPRARDQIAMFHDGEVTIYWNNKKDANEIDYARKGWTEGYISWSPKGSYLASVHRQGVQLWGGRSWSNVGRFPHPGVRFLDFSPCENYLVTLSPEPFAMPTGNQPWGPESVGHQIAIWSIATGTLMRSFPLGALPPQAPGATGPRAPQWPMFKWTSDDKYFARLFPGEKISVYEAPSMVMLEKKSITIEGVTEFEWQPLPQDTDNEAGTATPSAPTYMLAYFVPQIHNDRPASLTLMSIPSKKILRQKQVFFGIGCKIHFQSNGDFLLFKVDRTNRTKKAQYTTLEVFRLRERDYPSDAVEIKEIIVAFAWEPTGKRFALITNSEPLAPGADPKTVLGGTAGKMNAYFYEVQTTVERKGQALRPGGVEQIKALTNKSINSLFWSPRGRYIVLAGLRNLTEGSLEFWDTTANETPGHQHQQQTITSKTAAGVDVITKKEVESIQMMASGEHFMASDVTWDPTGRYVMSTVCSWGKQFDTGFILWEFSGQQLQKENVDQLKQAVWRPRPPTLLTKQQVKQIRKNLREYSRQFEEEDVLASSALSQAELEERKRLFDEWYAWRKSLQKQIDQLRAKRTEIHGSSRPDEDTIEEIVEEVVDEREEVVE